MKRLCLALLFLSASLNAETLFHKKDGTEISPEDHKVLYDIMIKYQFPSSVVYGTYVKDELKAMNDAIKKELPGSGIEATFMPTTLYDLFVMHFVNKYRDENINKASSGVIEDESLSEINLVVLPSNMQRVVKKQSLVAFHRSINNYIVKTLEERNLLVPNNVTGSLAIINTMSDLIDSKLFGDYFKISDKRNGRTIIKRAIEIDHLAYDANKYPLYRTASIVDIPEAQYTKKTFSWTETTWHSIAFGSSLFGGFIRDRSACVLHIYMNDPTNVVYALFVDRQSYAQGVLKSMLVIPPLIELINIFATGEYFHPRTKVPVLAKASGIMRTLHISDWSKQYEIQATSHHNAEEIYDYIRMFIKHHHVLVSGDSPIKLPQPPNKPLPPFPTGKAVKHYPAPQQPLPTFPVKSGASNA